MVLKHLGWDTVVDGLGPSFDPSFLRACKETNLFCPRAVTQQQTRHHFQSQSYITILNTQSTRPTEDCASRSATPLAKTCSWHGMSEAQLKTMQSKIFERQRIRIAKDYETSDCIRRQLFAEYGVVIYDNAGVWCMEDAWNLEYICGCTYDATVWREAAY